MNVRSGGSSSEKRLGKVVQDARKSHGLTQQELCQKSGLSYSTLAKIERGAIKAPSIFTIQNIAATLGIGLDGLMSGVPLERPMPKKKVSKNGVRFVYFDMNGCLVRNSGRALAQISEDSGVTPDVIETIFWQFNDDLNRGVMHVDERNTALTAKLNMRIDYAQYYLSACEATPGIGELVQWVQTNYRVGVLTNTMELLYQGLKDRNKIPDVAFDVVVDSSEVHMMKPDHRMFEIAAEKAGVEPEEILLIDDDRPNLVAAGRAGWHTMSFDAFNPEAYISAVRNALEPAT